MGQRSSESLPRPASLEWLPRVRVGAVVAQPFVGYLASLVSVALVTLLVALIESRGHFGSVSMLFLVAVLAVASAWGSGPAIVASLLSFLAFNYFFIEPRHTFSVGDPAQWVVLLLFLLTAVVTGQLAAGQRARAREAEHREREARSLFVLGRLLVGEAPERRLEAAAEHVRAELELDGCAVLLADERGTLHVQAAAGATPQPELAGWKLARGTETDRGALGRWVRVNRGKGPLVDANTFDVALRSDNHVLGVLRLVRGEHSQPLTGESLRLASAAADQLSAAVERARLAEEADQSELHRRSDQVKSVLLSTVSHDLRTPLAAIKASAESLLQKDVTWTEIQRDAFAAAIARETDRLNRLVGNLLDLSRIEGGALRPDLDWYPIGPLVQEVVARLRPLGHDHPVAVQVADDLPPARFDYVHVSQALSNLLDNVYRYTPPGTEVRITAHTIPAGLQLDVADRGLGLSTRDLDRVFDRFYRAERGRAGIPGTGLGLAVARGLIEAQGGRVWAHHTPGGGLTVSFTLRTDEAPA